jgi:uncharacterized protein YkwD
MLYRLRDLIVVLAACLVPALPWALTRAHAAPDLGEASRNIVELTNRFRGSAGLAPTTPNAQLNASAREFAAFMARTDQYGHEADGREPAQRAEAQGYDYCLVSENIAYEFSSEGFATQELASSLVQGWQDSPGHRHNMLDGAATETGVAIAQSPHTKRYYAVQMFGRPKALRVRFRVSNRSPHAVSYELGGRTYQLPPNVTRTHEQCRSEPLTMRLPGDPRATRVEPRNGERYLVERNGSKLRLTRG